MRREKPPKQPDGKSAADSMNQKGTYLRTGALHPSLLTVQHGDRSKQVRILLDSGSEPEALVSRDLVSELGLPTVPSTTPLRISGFNAGEPETIREIATVFSQELGEFKAGVVERLSFPLILGAPLVQAALRPIHHGNSSSQPGRDQVE